MEAGATVCPCDKDGCTPLHLAAASGAAAAVSFLCSQSEAGSGGGGSGVAARNKQGATPLHLAAKSGNPRTISILLSAGAKPAAVDYLDQVRRLLLYFCALTHHCPVALNLLSGHLRFHCT